MNISTQKEGEFVPLLFYSSTEGFMGWDDAHLLWPGPIFFTKSTDSNADLF
jgi:hypothetical protein